MCHARAVFQTRQEQLMPSGLRGQSESSASAARRSRVTAHWRTGSASALALYAPLGAGRYHSRFCGIIAALHEKVFVEIEAFQFSEDVLIADINGCLAESTRLSLHQTLPSSPRASSARSSSVRSAVLRRQLPRPFQLRAVQGLLAQSSRRARGLS